MSNSLFVNFDMKFQNVFALSEKAVIDANWEQLLLKYPQKLLF